MTTNNRGRKRLRLNRMCGEREQIMNNALPTQLNTEFGRTKSIEHETL